MPLLLDTCGILWYMSGVLPVEIEGALRAELDQGRRTYVSPMSAWEISMLYARGRVPLPIEPHEYFRQVLSNAALELAPLTPEILINSNLLPGTPPRDPSDRILAATARTQALTLVTRDRELLAYGEAGYLSVLPC